MKLVFEIQTKKTSRHKTMMMRSSLLLFRRIAVSSGRSLHTSVIGSKMWSKLTVAKHNCLTGHMQTRFANIKDTNDISLYLSSQFENRVFNLEQHAFVRNTKLSDIVAQMGSLGIYINEEGFESFKSCWPFVALLNGLIKD